MISHRFIYMDMYSTLAFRKEREIVKEETALRKEKEAVCCYVHVHVCVCVFACVCNLCGSYELILFVHVQNFSDKG